MNHILMALMLGFMVGCASSPATTANATDILVFNGTVTKIESSTIPQSNHNWIVTMHVDKVLSGNFPDAQFSFRVHSPTRSGLTENGTYRIEASRTGTGYVVDSIKPEE